MALIVLLIRTMDALKVFDTVYVLTRGGPGTSTYVASMYNYVLFFGNFQVGYAAAMSYIILIIVNVFAIALILRAQRATGARGRVGRGSGHRASGGGRSDTGRYLGIAEGS